MADNGATTGADGPRRDVIAIGASAGGVEALRALVAGLSPDLGAAVFVVLHVPRDAPSALPTILSRSGPLPARHARDGEPLRQGTIYVAPADHHILVIDGHVRLTKGPTENGHRPAVDPLFRSVARSHGSRVVGVVLSGARDDGAAGLRTVVEHGGLAVVQEPSDALHSAMPCAAMDSVRVDADHVLPASRIGPLLTRLAESSEPVAAPVPVAEPADPYLDAEVEMSELRRVFAEDLAGTPAGYGCPSCGGSLYELPGQSPPRYRCRVGHAWSPQSLLDEQGIALESALWMALRALEEKSALGLRMAETNKNRSRTHIGDRYLRTASEADRASRIIRELIASIGAAAPDISERTDAEVG